MRTHKRGPWVVYRATIKGIAVGPTAVCQSDEWDALQAARPGVHTLLRGDISNEAEAERLARGTAGDPVPRSGDRLRATVRLGDLPAVGH